MYDLLKDMSVVEGASFVAAPLASLHLLQMGAEIIRFDPIGGGPDHTRWPRADNGASYYWEGLNKGKKSVALDLRCEEGREIAQELAAQVGRLMTNYPADGFLAHERLVARRAAMITVRVMGWADGGNALDYTVNASLGVPYMTGPADLGTQPVNHVMPAWDTGAGGYAAFAMLAADRARSADGLGREVRVPLGDIAISSLAALGQLAEAQITACDRPRYGNDLYGAFGRDFATADGRRIMVTAISPRQWTRLLSSLRIEGEIAALEKEFGVSFAHDEGLRFVHRARLNRIVAHAIAAYPCEEIARIFDDNGVTWAPYRTLSEAVRNDPRVRDNPALSPVAHLTGKTYLTPGAPGTIPGSDRIAPGRAPRLGEHSEEILSRVMGLGSGAIGDLIDRKILACSPDLV